MNKYNKNFALPNEVWSPVKGYEGLYEVSSMGRVKSLNYNKTGKERMRVLTMNKDGYYRVILYKNGKAKWHQVHRLVAAAFLKNDDPEHKTQINHISEFEKENNHYSNLSWMTPKENVNYGTRNERVAEKMTNGKLSNKVYQFTLDGKFIKEWPSTNEVERQLGYGQGNISKCCLEKYKTAYGYKWSYKKSQNL